MQLNVQEGHRKRMTEKLMNSDLGAGTLYSYELLEMLLFFVKKREDTKPLAKELISRFRSLKGVFSSPKGALLDVSGIGPQTVMLFRLMHEICIRIRLEDLMEDQRISSVIDVVDYCSLCMSHLAHEQVRMLCLNKRNFLISDIILQEGSLEAVYVDIRSLIYKAIGCGSNAIILVHNHPSGSELPSDDDIKMTLKLKDVAASLGIKLFDHLIITKQKYFSMKSAGII